MVKLTDYAKSGGCAGKIGPAVLSNVLQQLPQQLHANLLVGLEPPTMPAYTNYLRICSGPNG